MNVENRMGICHENIHENDQNASGYLERGLNLKKNSSRFIQQISENRLIIANPDMSVEQARTLIDASRKDLSSYILVMQENRLMGILTHTDLAKLVNSGSNLSTIKLGEVAQWPTSILSEERIKQFFHTLSIFKQYWRRSLPVVDQQGQMVDIVTHETIRRAIYASLANSPEYSQKLGNELNSPEPWQRLGSEALDDGGAEFQQRLAQKTAEYGHVNRQLDLMFEQQKKLQTALEWQANSEPILGAIADFLHKSMDLKSLFQDIVAQVKNLFQADRVCLYRFHSDWSALAIAEAVNPDYPSLLGFLIRNELVSGDEWLKKYQAGQPCIVTDMANARQGQVSTVGNTQTAIIGDSTDTLLKFFQIKASLAIPIQRGQELWGLLVVHQCAVSREWQESEIVFLQRLAMQLGIGIEQIQLRQQVQQLQDDLHIQCQEEETRLKQTLDFEEMLQRITDRVRDSLDEDQILQTAVQELTMVLGVSCCQAVVCALSDDVTNCSIRHEYSIPTYASNETNKKFAFPELCDQVQNGYYSQFCWMQPFLNPGKESILVCPIFDDQGYLGCLRLFTSRKHIFNEQEIRVVQQVASHCAIAIRQARLYQAAQTQVRELERLNQLKDDFLSTVSHELRTPLSSIKMVTNLLKLSLNQPLHQPSSSAKTSPEFDQPAARTESVQSQPEQNPPGQNLPGQNHNIQIQNRKITQYLKTLEEECDREISLVNDLLATQQLNAGIHPLSLSTIRLQDWIPHIAETFHQRIQNNHQTLEINIPADLPPLVSDSFMLSRILVELLINAWKYTPAGGDIQVLARSLPERNPNSILIQVKNSGVEISADELPRIFDPFYRIPNNNPWKHSGTGLGLSLTKKLVEYLGGTIHAESGSREVCFVIKLPIEAPV
jgi:signal transduction histidine kinase/predicted transcriptional regulator